MTRRRPKALVPALVGLLGVLLLLLALLQMVQAERDDATDGAKRHEALVASFAKGELAARLQNRLGRTQTVILATRADPLKSCRGCVFELAGRQILPRLSAQGSQAKSVRYWVQSLHAGQDSGDSMWAERIAARLRAC